MTGLTEYPITTYQPKYFVAESFDRAKEQIMEYSKTNGRPFSISYDAYTNTVKILNTKTTQLEMLREAKGALEALTAALQVSN